MFRADPDAAHEHGLDEKAVTWLLEAFQRYSPDNEQDYRK